MKIIRLTLFIFLTIFSINCSAKDIQELLTSDYGVLKGNFKRIYSIPPDNLSDIYWQCFARNNIKIELETLTDFDDFNYNDEVDSLIAITTRVKNGDIHSYVVRRAWPIDTYKEMFNRWVSLIKQEKYVCIAGSGFSVDSDSKDRKKYTWYFEKLKTTKGCASYFSDNTCQNNA